MANAFYQKDKGTRLPTLFLDAAGTNLVKKAGEEIGKVVVEEQACALMDVIKNGLKKDTIYHASCDEQTLYEQVHQLQAAQTYFRLGINLPSDKAELLEELLQNEISIVLASDRSDLQWQDHFQRSMQFLIYIDPLFQPHLVERYRTMHEAFHREPIQDLHLDTNKARAVLSEAEVRIFEKILEGKSNRKIAEECFLAVATVNNHVSHLTRKMEANDRTHTIKRAIEEGWVQIS
ncbi:response regulator transcription factor [Salibacterium aidingense]|uniref:response regulator transcription factor n=1 Tax=Salibacterium aidingense TaxID=384933 RepID=UPI00040C52FD|nr:LuxR C-terminal-related transcriptional regulator [Salibacterium aidingense]